MMQLFADKVEAAMPMLGWTKNTLLSSCSLYLSLGLWLTGFVGTADGLACFDAANESASFVVTADGLVGFDGAANGKLATSR